jgi:hypothetical protein
MAQLKRKDFAHYFDTSATEEVNWELEGIGVEALSLAYNPQIDTFKQIIDDVASSTFDSYQIQSSVSGKRIDKDDKIWKWLNEARKKAESIETKMLEINMASGKGEGTLSYEALQYNVLVVINEFLGENATISYDVYVKGKPVIGSVTMASGKPTFAESAD